MNIILNNELVIWAEEPPASINLKALQKNNTINIVINIIDIIAFLFPFSIFKFKFMK